MIASLVRTYNNLLGRGDAAVTVPPLDGPLRPNRLLDTAPSRQAIEAVDSLVSQGGVLLAAAGNRLLALGADGQWRERGRYGRDTAGLAAVGSDGLAIAFADGEIVIEGGAFAGRAYRADAQVTCITALVATPDCLYVANGSASNAAADWQRDLLERNATGSIWRIDLKSGTSTRLAGDLAWPSGLALDAMGLVFSEAWRHRLVRLDQALPGQLETLQADLPAYPGRLAPAADGYWLALFAPRSQLVEFVLREPAYCWRMMAEVPQAFWVAPRLRSGSSFYESLQGGAVKHLGMVKPWAPTMSAGLCVKLDATFRPRSSLQSRADGRTHGVTSVAEHGGQLFVAARGDGVVVALPLADMQPGTGDAP